MRKMLSLNFYKNYVHDISVLEHMPHLREVHLGHNPIRDLSVLFELQDLIDVKVDGIEAPEAHKKYLEDHMARNRARLGVEPAKRAGTTSG
jgi:Leucine-rich repeat (LRR) protein